MVRRVAVRRRVAAELGTEWRRQRLLLDDARARRTGADVVAADGRRLPGVAAAFHAPAEHRADIARRVLDGFAGLPAFLLPHPSRMPRTLAVVAEPSEFRDRLARIAREPGWYVAPPDPRMPGGVGSVGAGWEGDVVRVFAMVAGTGFAYGPSLAVEAQRWSVDDAGAWVAPVRNRSIERAEPEQQRMGTVRTVAGAFPTLSTTAVPSITDVTFPVDVVYTWVDGADLAWQRARALALGLSDPGEFTESAAAEARFRQHDELRYSLRSLERHAPWVNHVWIVTAGQVPAWLDTEHPGVTVVPHEEIWSPEGILPTFNSHAIEAHLHRIEGLSEHFLYLNDDVFLGRECSPEHFFEANGLQRVFLSSALVPDGDPRPGEIASASAGKNARRLIEDLSGRRLRRKLFHAPFALRRSVSYEIAERYPDEVRETTRSVFRRTSDITVSGALHMYYALATGRATVSRISYHYLNTGAPDIELRMRRALRRPYEVFCLNDTGVGVDDPVELDRRIRGFLHDSFPNTSSYER